LSAYREFLEAKRPRTPVLGAPIDAGKVHAICKPHQKALIQWAVAGGRRAIFAKFGLGKSIMQLEVMHLTLQAHGGKGLIIAPLGVRQEFRLDAAKLGRDLPFIRTTAEMVRDGLYITNYESVREGKIDVTGLTAVSLDEASVLRGFGGTKTFREFMRLFVDTPYRFVATATPAPNEYIEILSYAAFLGVMDVGEAKTRFFKRNSEKADQLTLHPHKEEEFWLWVNSWAVFLQRPSDLGFSDEGYDLPPLDVRWHPVASTGPMEAMQERDGQGILLRTASMGVQQAAAEKRSTMSARIARVRELVEARPEDHVVIWHDLEDERRALEDVLPLAEYDNWIEFKDGHPDAIALYDRHYSAFHHSDGRERKLVLGPGEKTVLLTRDRSALFCWRKFIDDSGQVGVNCAVFRNEGDLLSSDLIREAMAIAHRRWPGERLYTYVDRDEIRSSNPGACFQIAGWRRCGKTKGGLDILEATPEVESAAIAPRMSFASVYGSQDLDEREEAVMRFANGAIARLAAKPVMLGSGCNLQRHCHWAIFAGVGFKFNDFIQAIHRLYRFLQGERVVIDIIFGTNEAEVVTNLKAKWKRYDEMMERMAEIIRRFGLSTLTPAGALERSIGVERMEVRGERFHVVRNDTVEETASMPAESVDLIVTSIPFGTQYEYTPSYNDFGHTDDDAHFFAQMNFLSGSLHRVLRPGRVMAVHVKDRVRPGGMDGLGFQNVSPFHAETILHYRRHGFVYMGMITVVTDVVRENNQTYRLGWTEQCKDGSRMGVGMPEYVLLFRKPPTDASDGYADVRVVKSKEAYSRARWQIDAHGFWKSSGNRLLKPDELIGLDADDAFRRFRGWSFATVYDHPGTIAVAEALDANGQLPPGFMLLQAQSWHPDVWTDVARMRTLNGAQEAAGREMHLCPLQFDIVDRLIARFSNPDELVYDPFGGLMTVPFCAIKLGRRGLAVELNSAYVNDGVRYLRAAEEEMATPTLFDLAGDAA